MSPENIETVRAIYEHWSSGDFRGGLPHFDPEVEFTLSREFPDTGTYRGPEEISGYMRQFLEPWELLTIEAQELTDLGDTVIAEVLQSGVGAGSGVPASVRYFQRWTLRDGRILRIENFRDRPA
jgi:ketosteroid isomerase-like protein